MEAAPTTIEIAVPFRIFKTLHYTSPAEMPVGSVVEVSLRQKQCHGFVVGGAAGSPTENSSGAKLKLKPIQGLLSEVPVFDEKMLRLLRWISDYYCHPIGEVIAAAIPKGAWGAIPKERVRASRRRSEDEAMEAAFATPKLEKTPDQALAIEQILDRKDVRPRLLQGVTGSGKTEVYLGAIETFLAEGKGAIVLVPEIALTPQLAARFSSRFPGQVAVLHSGLGTGERLREWRALQTGQKRIAVGARSAVFAPIQNLGLIVVDEEQETSFKQEDSVRYHARDAAVVRGSFEKATVVLGSATPSVESFANAQQGKYAWIRLPKRVHETPMPKVEFVDLKQKGAVFSPQTPWLSQLLVDKLHHCLEHGKQALLYLNRLGYAHLLYCGDCGHTWKCRHCDVSLTYYQSPPHLKCHYCNSTVQVPTTCEACQSLKLQPIGIGTEQVDRVLTATFPKARILRLDRSVIKTQAQLVAALGKIAQGECDFVIGTQMVAKGHDFPRIALVGILMADAQLNLPDFRAQERTFQTLTQVAGRAGRSREVGEVVVQTFNPDHPVLVASATHAWKDFYEAELAMRQLARFPPFCRLAILRFQHTELAKTKRMAEQTVGYLRARTRSLGDIEILGPSEAPLSRLKSKYRWHCLIKSPTVSRMRETLRMAADYWEKQKWAGHTSIDMDPSNSL